MKPIGDVQRPPRRAHHFIHTPARSANHLAV
jgi:hypothetical protein